MLGQLLTGADVGDIAHAGAADLFGIGDAHHAHIGQLVPGLLGEPLFFVDLFRQGLDFILGKFAVHLTEHLLLVCQMKIHIPLTPFLVGADFNYLE